MYVSEPSSCLTCIYIYDSLLNCVHVIESSSNTGKNFDYVVVDVLRHMPQRYNVSTLEVAQYLQHRLPGSWKWLDSHKDEEECELKYAMFVHLREQKVSKEVARYEVRLKQYSNKKHYKTYRKIINLWEGR